jgi:hypothetical protein
MRAQRADATPRIALSSVHWRRVVPSLCLYYTLDGLLVAAFLLIGSRRPRPSPALRRVLAVVATFACIALLRGFLDSGLPLIDQLRFLARALGGSP